MSAGDRGRLQPHVRALGPAVFGVLLFITGCQSADTLPAADALPPSAAARVAVDLAQWPFGSREKPYQAANGGRSAGPRFLRRQAAAGVDLPASWTDALRRAAGPPSLDQISAVNHLVNAIPYAAANSTAWKSPGRFLREGGGCNCYAIAKYVLLRRLGYGAEQLRITVVRRRNSARTHSILVVRLGPGRFGKFVLDNAAPEVRTALYASDYQALASVNENGVWLHDPGAAAVARYLANPPLSER